MVKAATSSPSRPFAVVGLLTVFGLPGCDLGGPEPGFTTPDASTETQPEVTDVAAETARQALAGLWSYYLGVRGNWPSTDDSPITAEGQAMVDNYIQDEDPSVGCVFSLGRIIPAPFPMEILLNVDRATILYENDHEVRRIYMDGRDHPDDLFPALMGHSIGWWEGNTLVVETVGLEGSYFLNGGDLPYSDSTRLTERYTSLDDGRQIHFEIVVNDPIFYHVPWTVTWIYGPADEILEYRCLVREHLQPERTL